MNNRLIVFLLQSVVGVKSLSLEEIDGIVLNKTVNKRKNLAFVLVLDKTSRFGLAD